jgi:pimeloyl-ACP methyl ester carboxylesterase
VGATEPHTLFAHGLAGSIPTTRPYATRVSGTRSFLHFRGHGASPAPEDGNGWTYAELSAELWAVADAVGASRALGVSMGAGALCAGLAHQPERFDRVVLVLPAVVDRPRPDAAVARFAALADAVDAGDLPGIAAHLLEEQPERVRGEQAVQVWCREQAARLVGAGVAAGLRSLPHQVAVTDRELLRRVQVPVLVLAQEDDPAHPAAVAEELATLLPGADLHVLPPGGIMWEHRARVRDLVGSFLGSDPSTVPGPPASPAHGVCS